MEEIYNYDDVTYNIGNNKSQNSINTTRSLRAHPNSYVRRSSCIDATRTYRYIGNPQINADSKKSVCCRTRDRPQNEILNVFVSSYVRIDVGVGSEERDGYDTATHNNERLIRFERTKLRDRERKREEERRERDKCASFFVFAQLWKRSSEEVLEGSRAPAGNGGGVPRELAPRTSILRKDTYPSSSYSRQTERRTSRGNRR